MILAVIIVRTSLDIEIYSLIYQFVSIIEGEICALSRARVDICGFVCNLQ